MTELARRAAALLGTTLRRSSAIGGGDLSVVVRIELEDGREAIVKSGDAVRTEAAMLEAIGASGAPAPKVLAVEGGLLVIDALDAVGGPDWAELGRAVATMHRAAGDRYGWHEDYAFGSVAIPNGWSDDWPAFWGERRLLTHLPHITGDVGRRVEAVALALPELLPEKPTPSLLHGDLWSGNVLFGRGGKVGLIDPACYYGHSEVDFAMLELFGGPSRAFYEAYGDIEAGRSERMPIYQLWPALVHLRLFGSGYRSMVERLLAAAGF